MVTNILIAFGLAMDAFAVSITCGMSGLKNALKIPLFFGFFQAGMPVIGWLIGVSLRNYIYGIDHWVVFGLLSLIGCKMIYESMKTTAPIAAPHTAGFSMGFSTSKRELNIYVLLMLSVATSIDALAVGISFAVLKIPILTPIIVIGVITFLLSFIGIFIGNRLGRFLGNKIKIVGGLILIGIGTKILVGHLA
ncbi:MAG: manganese efflux pump [Candidatus Stahlbacteria bacterium]|nr:manganese efflux pump [Candidatus Stahlbacteria bacterium]